MAEITAILRTLLYQVERAKTLDEAKQAVKVMCSDEDIAIIEQRIAEIEAK